MDVMKPELIWIDDACYRINDINLKEVDNQVVSTYHDTDFEFTCPLEPLDDYDDEGIEEDNGMFKTNFHVAKAYHAYLIGSKGSTKRNIEVETRTKVIIPKQGLTTSDIIVKGQQKNDVRLARSKILTMVRSVKNRNKPTHFIAIPLISDTMCNNLVKFKQEVMKNNSNSGIDDNMFTDPLKFHLTLGTMVISDQFERDEALKAFEACVQNVVKPMLNGIKIDLKIAGLDYMNDDPSEVRVLFAKVSSSQDYLLNQIVDKIRDELSTKGIMKAEKSKWLCHATLIKSHNNTRFNATKIFELYNDLYFGEVDLKQIDIASMKGTDANDGYYKVSNSILL